jgi:AraC-like DNA-binding protein
MAYSSLSDMIRFLQYGTRLHIGIVFLGGFSGSAFDLPHSQTIHSGAVCWKAKSCEGGSQRCYRCRQAAIRKAMRTCTDFGGYCINGVYEYTRPVIKNGKCVAVIYIGNIRGSEDRRGRLHRTVGGDPALLETMETNFDFEKCRRLGKLIESYLIALSKEDPENSGSKSSTLVENIKSYLKANYDGDISLKDVASLFHYNPQYLGRIFKQETGMRFSEYLNQERIRRATAYLDGDTTVISAAYQAGFNNVTYFNRVFRQQTGKTPSEYKKGM